MYLLIGCDDFGFAVLREFQNRKVFTVVMDDDERRIEYLRRLGFKEEETLLVDFKSPDFLSKVRMESVSAVVISLHDFEKVKCVLSAIRDFRNKHKHLDVDPVVIVRVEDEVEAAEFRKLGADEVLPTNQLLQRAAVGIFDRMRLMASERRLEKIFRENWKLGRLAIILQNNPDPDSIASGLALKLYAKAKQVDADLIYDGVIGHPQNRALVNLLGIDLLEVREVDLRRRYRWYALVDVSTSANSALPPDQIPTIVIDHHTAPSSEVKGNFVVIAPVAATATLMTTFLRLARIDPDPIISAALFLGLVTDTMRFARKFTHLDMEVFEYLNGRMDRTLYAKLTSPELVPEHLQLFMRALKSSRVQEDFRFANLGEVDAREAIAVVADFLVGQEGINTVIAYGLLKDKLYVSARTRLPSLHLGKLLRDAFGEESAGGHASMAGATLTLSRFYPGRKGMKRRIDTYIKRKVLLAAGVLKPKRKYKS